MITFISKRTLFISLLVFLPVFIFIGFHYSINSTDTGLLPTGFFNGEAPYYMANARQYIDHGFNSIFYGNPFSYLEISQRVYFQFQTYLLALMIKFLPFSVGTIWVLFGCFFGLLLVIQAARLFELIGVSKKYLFMLVLLYAWGGGVHSILGFISEFFSSFSVIEGIKAFEKFEIADGWWMHSVGRNFLMPNYIYYHFLVMTGIIYLVQRNNNKLIALGFVLSFSHPFVGAQFLFSLFVWLSFEKYFLKSIEGRYFSLLSSVALLLIHVLYYFLFLGTSSEHVAQELQWSVSYETLYENWAMRAINFIPSYIVVVGLFVYQIRSPQLFTRFFRSYVNRFLAVFGLVNFLLANHEFVMKPIQPIHFTHGMVWFPFLILGRETILEIVKFLKSKCIIRKIAAAAFILLFVSDNILWVAKRGYQTHVGKSQTELKLYTDQKEVIDFINEKIDDNSLFFVDDTILGFHLCVYTSARVFASHNIITPNSLDRRNVQDAFIETGKLPEYIRKDVYVLTSKQIEFPAENISLFTNKKYQVLKVSESSYR
jgi:hypothetical protein